jgi:stage IV sporulation protein FB
MTFSFRPIRCIARPSFAHTLRDALRLRRRPAYRHFALAVGELQIDNQIEGGGCVLLFEPDRTPYDLRWRMFGIEVRVHPMFWLVSAILGANALDFGFQYLLFWMACMFVSILVHELGHIWMGQVFGSHGHVVLYGFGGLAIGSNTLRSPWQRIAVCLAGPFAGFLFLALVFAVIAVLDPVRLPVFLEVAKIDLGLHKLFDWAPSPQVAMELSWVLGSVESPPAIVDFVMTELIFINLLWGLVNLLPIWPLDGGQISRDLCKMASPDRGLRISLGISLVCAGLLALHCFMAAEGRPLLPFLTFGSRWSALFFAIFAVQSFLLLQQAGPRNRDFGDWERDPEIWGR